MITFSCPACAVRMEAPDHRGGTKTRCLRCHQKILIPAETLPDNRHNRTVLGSLDTLTSRATTNTLAPAPLPAPVSEISLCCPHCAAALTVPSVFSGTDIACPICEHDFRLPGSSTAILAAPPLAAPAPEPFEPRSTFCCPFCRSTSPPRIERKVSSTGWAVFFTLLILTIVFCFLGLFIWEDHRRCSSCGVRLD